jgi:hypothetical protein
VEPLSLGSIPPPEAGASGSAPGRPRWPKPRLLRLLGVVVGVGRSVVVARGPVLEDTGRIWGIDLRERRWRAVPVLAKKVRERPLVLARLARVQGVWRPVVRVEIGGIDPLVQVLLAARKAEEVSAGSEDPLDEVEDAAEVVDEASPLVRAAGMMSAP